VENRPWERDAASPGKQFQEFGNGRDFIRCRVRLDLTEAQTLRGGPRAYNVDRRLRARRVEGPPQRLAVHGDHLPGQFFGHRLDPGQKRGAEGVGIQGREDAAKARNRHPVVSPADRRAQRDHEDVHQRMPTRAVDAGIGQRPEMIRNRR